MAMRKSLPHSIARQLAEFVDTSVRDLLMKRTDFDESTREEISAIVRRRLDYADQEERTIEPVAVRLARMKDEGSLNEEAITDALAMRDNDFVVSGLAHMAGTSPDDARRIIQMGAAKPIIALVWRAGLSMRMALQIQKDLGRIPPKELIYPRDGTDYPLTPAELKWQAEFLGI
jgi:hypothetical protein